MTARLVRSLAILTAIAAFPSGAFPRLVSSQANLARGNIVGKVFGSEKGVPQPGVVVIAHHISSDQRFYSQPTDSQGNFFFGNVPAGVYAFSLGYQGAEYAVEEHVDGRSDLDFVLRPSFRLVGEKAFLIQEEAEAESKPPAPDTKETGEEPRLERGENATVEPSIPSSEETSAVSQASDLLQSRSYAEAASAFSQYFRTEHMDKFTIALAIYCDHDNITRVVADSGGSEQLFILPHDDQTGRSCYGVFWGIFDTHSAAERATVGLPAAIRRPDSRPIPIYRLIRGKPSTAIDAREQVGRI
jgi:hypothetical protein